MTQTYNGEPVEWYTFYSEKDQREYYHEPKSNITTWILPANACMHNGDHLPPGCASDGSTATSRGAEEHHDETHEKDEGMDNQRGKCVPIGSRVAAIMASPSFALAMLVLSTVCSSSLLSPTSNHETTQLESIGSLITTTCEADGRGHCPNNRESSSALAELSLVSHERTESKAIGGFFDGAPEIGNAELSRRRGVFDLRSLGRMSSAKERGVEDRLVPSTKATTMTSVNPTRKSSKRVQDETLHLLQAQSKLEALLAKRIPTDMKASAAEQHGRAGENILQRIKSESMSAGIPIKDSSRKKKARKQRGNSNVDPCRNPLSLLVSRDCRMKLGMVLMKQTQER